MSTVGLVTRLRCPACDAETHREVLREPYAGSRMTAYLRWFYGDERLARISEVVADNDFSLRRCDRCGLTFQEMAPDENATAELYDEWIDAEASRRSDHAKGSAPGHALQVLEILDHFRRPAAELVLLDFGMGWGEWCRVAGAMGCTVFGVDLSSERQEDADRNGVATLTVDMLSDHEFDFINTEQVVEHLARPYETLEPLVESLRPGGVLRVSVPNCLDLDRRLDVGDWTAPKGSVASLNAVAPLEHLNAFTHGSLVALGRRLGLEPVYRATRQLRFAPVAGTETGTSVLRFAAARWYRAVRHQDTQIWFRR